MTTQTDAATRAAETELRPPPRPAAARYRLKVIVLRILLLIGLAVLWQVLAVTEIVDPIFISSPVKVAGQVRAWLADGTLASNTWVTFVTALIGWSIACVAAIVLGFVTASFRTLDDVVRPLVDAAAAAPRFALIPVFIVWFGIGIGSKIALVISVVFILVYVATNASAKSADRDLLTLMRTLGARKFNLITKVIVPWSVPFVLSSLRLGWSYSLAAVIVGEITVSQAGLGNLIARSAGMVDMTGIFAAVLAVIVFAYLISIALQAVEKRLLRWKPSLEGAGNL